MSELLFVISYYPGGRYHPLTGGIACAVLGVIRLKRAWDGDTRLPGTLITFIPKWIFISSGLLLQLPLLIYFLKEDSGN
ncbi:hypothetical protein N9F44_00435 [Akkermansiaceae bacterium]|nr:hypothetical protein [Akkermansiaceae bacterium]